MNIIRWILMLGRGVSVGWVWIVKKVKYDQISNWNTWNGHLRLREISEGKFGRNLGLRTLGDLKLNVKQINICEGCISKRLTLLEYKGLRSYKENSKRGSK